MFLYLTRRTAMVVTQATRIQPCLSTKKSTTILRSCRSSQLETAMGMIVAMAQEINGVILQEVIKWERMLLPRPILERMTISKRARAEDQHRMTNQARYLSSRELPDLY